MLPSGESRGVCTARTVPAAGAATLAGEARSRTASFTWREVDWLSRSGRQRHLIEATAIAEVETRAVGGNRKTTQAADWQYRFCRLPLNGTAYVLGGGGYPLLVVTTRYAMSINRVAVGRRDDPIDKAADAEAECRSLPPHSELRSR